MKKKMLLMMLALTVSVALIAGATMAWFTAEDETKDAVFKTGTVEIKAKGAKPLGEKGIKNVNPGDCYILEYNIKNTGSKQIELRSIFNTAWEDNLSRKNIFIVPHKDSDWVLYQPDDAQGPGKKIYAYYMGGPVDPEESVKLNLVVYFDGALTGNNYQGKEFTVSGDVEAVQASHEAASEVWGDGWDTVTGDGYSFDYEGWYLNELDPEDIDCYDADLDDPEEPDPSQTPEPEPEIGPVNEFSFDYELKQKGQGYGAPYKIVEGQIFSAKDENNNIVSGEKVITVTVNRSIHHDQMSKTITVDLDEDGNASYSVEFDQNISGSNTNIKITIDGADGTLVAE